MDRRLKVLKTPSFDIHSEATGGIGGRKVPYLLCPSKKPEQYSDNELDWLKKRDEKRKGHTPSGWWNYFMECLEVKIRDNDSLALWISQSCPNDNAEGVGGDVMNKINGTTTTDLGIKSNLPLILFLHGGGYSGLTWAPMVDELSRLIVAEYAALDLRGHGESRCQDETDLSLDTLARDVLDAIKWMQNSDKVQLGYRKLILIGHSMGGALAVNVALRLEQNDNVNVSGLVVLDVVEGSALLALNSMQFVLRGRPQEFSSLPDAIQWCTRSGQTRNLDSARVSMTGQLVEKSTRAMATQFVTKTEDGLSTSSDNRKVSSKRRIWSSEEDIKAIGESGSIEKSADYVSYPTPQFKWRIDLSVTEPYWRGWFEGLSKKFLSPRCPKLLMLAGVDRLDKELTVGQMQGKFQMQVFHQVGHAVHEDVPDKAAECVAAFLCRQRISISKGTLPPSMPGC